MYFGNLINYINYYSYKNYNFVSCVVLLTIPVECPTFITRESVPATLSCFGVNMALTIPKVQWSCLVSQGHGGAHRRRAPQRQPQHGDHAEPHRRSGFWLPQQKNLRHVRQPRLPPDQPVSRHWQRNLQSYRRDVEAVDPRGRTNEKLPEG